MKKLKKNIDDLTRPYFLESMLQIALNLLWIFLLLIFMYIMDIFAIFIDGTFNIFLVLILGFVIFIIRDLRLMLLMLIDKKATNIKTVRGYFKKSRHELTFSKKDMTSCVGWFYPKEADVSRYIVTIWNFDKNRKYKLRICLPWAQFVHFQIISKNAEVTIHYLKNCKIIVGVRLEKYDTNDKDLCKIIKLFEYFI